MHKSILIFSLLALTFSCAQDNNSAEKAAGVQSENSMPRADNINSEYKMNAPDNGSNHQEDLEYEKRKLIWIADLEFKVKDVDKATVNIGELCEKYGAHVSDMDLRSSTYRVENEIQIRVKNERFHKLVAALKGQSIYMDKAKINSNDVTEEFVDIESRLNSKKEVRDRYIQILRNKTGTIEDVLEAEEKIRKITEEIEAKEGRLRYLQDQVNYSTISMLIYHNIEGKKPPVAREPTYGDEMSDSFNSGWSEVKSFLLGLVSIWPFLLILTSVIIWQRKRIRNFIQSIRKK